MGGSNVEKENRTSLVRKLACTSWSGKLSKLGPNNATPNAPTVNTIGLPCQNIDIMPNVHGVCIHHIILVRLTSQTDISGTMSFGSILPKHQCELLPHDTIATWQRSSAPSRSSTRVGSTKHHIRRYWTSVEEESAQANDDDDNNNNNNNNYYYYYYNNNNNNNRQTTNNHQWKTSHEETEALRQAPCWFNNTSIHFKGLKQ